VIVSSLCFAFKKHACHRFGRLALWPRSPCARVRCRWQAQRRGCARWPALGSAGCAPCQVWPPPLRVMCAYCRVTHRAAPCFPYHFAPPCSERSQPLTLTTSPQVPHALYSCGVCDVFRRVNLTVSALCFSACCSCLAKSINN
jgi:hypothetical protein